jgi:iron complex outermembrane receptor protein
MRTTGRQIVVVLCLSFLSACAVRTEEVQKNETKTPPATDIADLSIEELLNIKVTSVSKKAEPLSQTASAIYVITQEDIRRSGVSSIAEALRMAPGLNVAQTNSHAWAISARGFQSGLANKLLVLIDGRSVYTPLYSGVYWDQQDTMLEDIERIEVIRGPGATVWGANAVNGVINIITKNSKDTQGGLASASVGTEERTTDSVRYGGKIGSKVTYRAYLKYLNRDGTSLAASDTSAYDAFQVGRGGTRFDIEASKCDKILLTGDYYSGKHDEKVPVATLTSSRTEFRDARLSGGNFLSRWDHEFSDTSNASLQMYFDEYRRKQIVLDQEIQTTDLDYNQHLKLDRHEIVFGAGYRRWQEQINNNFVVSFLPSDRVTNIFSVFAQDEIEVLKDKFSITLGSKFEHNDFTGVEIQPSIRTLWRAAKGHTVWTSVARAVRTPSPLETDLRLNAPAPSANPGDPPSLFALLPNRDIPSEVVISGELGYRAELHKRFSIDVATFYNDYDNLRSIEFGTPFTEAAPAPQHLTIPLTQEPDMNARTFGGEFSAAWNPIDRLKFNAGYSFLRIFMNREDRAKSTSAEAPEGQSPRHQFHARAYLDLPHRLQFDTAVYFVDRLDTLNVPSYTRVDVRLGWRPTDNFDVSIGGQNLFREEHREFAPGESKIERNFYLKCTLKF